MTTLFLDGMDLTGKSTIANELEKRGYIRAPKVTEMGLIPAEISKRVEWFEKTPIDTIIDAILQSDLLRRKKFTADNIVFERGRITIVANCIAKAMTRERSSYKHAKELVYAICDSRAYAPKEDVRVYLRTRPEDLPALEMRKLSREGRSFDAYEHEYYPRLIHALEEESRQHSPLIIDSFTDLHTIIRYILGKFEEQWKKS